MEGYSFALYRTPDGPHVMSPEIRNIITDFVLNIFMFEDNCLLGCDAMWSGNVYHHCREMRYLHLHDNFFHLERRGSIFLRNTSTELSDYTASHLGDLI